MANPEHLAILKKGVGVWNAWRKQNPKIKPDLAHANLGKLNLSRADLIKVDLAHADLSTATISKADLSGASLFKTKLGKANLSHACLAGAFLSHACLDEANLTGADLSEADLTDVSLRRARLIKARLCGAKLSEASLVEANLAEADLTHATAVRAHLAKTDLSGADLAHADLTDAKLTKANLTGANLSWANLQGVDVRFCQLCRCNLTGAELTRAKLYATARDDWIIDSIQCRYIHWTKDGHMRSPSDRDLAPGEFEQLYRALPIVEYVFQNGMTPLDPLIMDGVVQAIREQNPEYDIKIDSISARGLAPSIKFTVQQEGQKEPALAKVSRMYERKLQEFAGRLDEARAFIQLLVDRPNPVYIGTATAQYLAIGGSTINIDQHVEYITNLRDTVAALPEDSPTFTKVAKKTALDIIGSALKDVAKGQVKRAAEQIIELGKDLGPVIVRTAAYAAFKSMVPGG